MDTKIERQSSVSDADQQPLAVGEREGVRVVAMCTFEAVQDYELGFRQYDVLTAIAKAEEIGGKIGLFPSECVEILKGYPDRLPLFKIFLSDDGTDGGIDVLQISNDDVPVHQQMKHISPSASTASLVSSSSSTEVDTTPRQRASTHPEPDVAVVSCYRCNAQVSIKKGQSFYPCECGANVKRPDVDEHHQEEAPSAAVNNTKRRRCNTAGAAVGGVVREETPKQRKKREKLEREQKKKQDEEERKFRERRDKGRLSASQWNRQVDSARERLWRASVIMTGPNGESTNDDGSASMLSTDDNISTVGSSAFDVDTFEDARSDSPRDISSFSSALSGRSLSRSGSLTSMPVNPESAKAKRDRKKTKEQRKKEKEEKKRLKKLEKEEREEKRKMERMGREKKRRNSLFGSSSGSIATRKQRDKLTTATTTANPADSVTVTINPITAHAKKQQQQMKAKTMVKTKSGKVMSLEEVEREGKKSNWDVSRLFSVRIGAGAGGRVNKQQAQKQRKASVGAADASHAQVIQRAAQQERELQEAARQLEEERRRFAEERQRFEQERLKVMLMLAQDMEGVKMARDGTPMYPSPANHPLLLVPTEPSPIASFAASQSSFTCLPSATATATLSADALAAPYEASSASGLPHSTPAPHHSGGTSNSTPSLPSLYNPSLASMPSSVATPSAGDDDGRSPSSSADDVDVRESAEAVPASPRKPPSGGVFLPFLMAPRAGGPQQQRNATNASAGAHQMAESEAAAELEEKLLDQLKNTEDDDSHVDEGAVEAESGTSSDEEEDELSDEDSTSSEEEVRVQPAVDKLMREKRKITVAPIQGIADMKGLDDDDDDDDDDQQHQRQHLDGSWITAISPRRRERDQHQLKAAAAAVNDADKEISLKDVIVRPGMSTSSSSSSSTSTTSSTSVAADKAKKVSFAAGGASSWTSAESPRRMLEALRAQGASQAEIDRERKRLLAGNVVDHNNNSGSTGGGRTLTPAAAAIATKYEEEIDQLLEKMKQLRDRSSSDDSWGDTSSDSDLDVDDKEKQKQKPHDISSDDDDEEVADEDDDESEAEVVIPEWTRGPPKSLQEMRDYKDFVRARYEAEKRETERMLRRNQREMRARGMTLPSSTAASHAPSHADHRASWII